MGIEPKPAGTEKNTSATTPVTSQLQITSQDARFLTEVADYCGPINEESVRVLVLVGRRVTKEIRDVDRMMSERTLGYEKALSATRQAYTTELDSMQEAHTREISAWRHSLELSHQPISDPGFGFGLLTLSPKQKRVLQKHGITRLYDFTRKTHKEIGVLVGQRKVKEIEQMLNVRRLSLKP